MSKSTRIKFVTEGMLLRETLSDPMLRQYGIVILDEAHERTTNTDVLLGLLKQMLVCRRGLLQLIIVCGRGSTSRLGNSQEFV